MKLIHQLLGLLLGLIIGLLTSFSALCVFVLWIVTDTKKKPAVPRPSEKDYTSVPREMRNTSSYQIIFDTEDKADEFIREVSRIGKFYNKVTVADISNLIGHKPSISDSRVGWRGAPETIKSREINQFVVGLPAPLSFKED